MKKIIQIFSIFGIMLSISVICNSCKTSSSNQESLSELRCDCNDMDCWREKTGESSIAALTCAAETGLLATGTILAAKIKKLI